MKHLAEFFSLLSDETRLRCLMLLSVEGELCVCDLSQTLDCIQPKVSRHLSLLRNSKVVADERRGQWVYYRLNENLDKEKREILAGIVEKLKHSPFFVSDRKKLAKCKKANCC